MPIRVGVLTISDRVSRGEMADTGGDEVVNVLRRTVEGVDITRATVADELEDIRRILIGWSDVEHLDAVVTTGGTGLGPRDITPQATEAVISGRIPGIEESIRQRGMEHIATAMLSRGVAGFRNQTLIVNLAGSPNAAREGAEVIVSVLTHAVDLLHGRTRHSHST